MSSFDGVYVATASAGTGKTTALIARLLSWSLGEGWERTESQLTEHLSEWTHRAPEDVASRLLGRVVCITFTEKAAAQMVEKFAEGLTFLSQGKSLPGLDSEALPQDQETLSCRIDALIACQDQLNLTTIHAFCRGILARHPLEAQLHPGFVIDADQRILSELCKNVVESSVRASLEVEGEHKVIQLLLHGVSPADVAESLSRLVLSGISPEELSKDPFRASVLNPFVQSFREDLDAFTSRFSQAFLVGRTKAALRATDSCVALWEELREVDDPFECLQQASLLVREGMDEKIRNSFKKWQKGELTGSETKNLGETSDDFIRLGGSLSDAFSRLRKTNPALLRLAGEALSPLLKDCLERLRVSGVMTFPQLLTSTARLLRENPSTVAAKERRRMDQLMVDEFQDTDEEQCSIIRMLALRGDPSHRPGLFLVGDPKQSIYGWRNADLTTYTRFIQEVVTEHQAQGHPLTTNWRSCPEVIGEVNRVFNEVMEEEKGFQPEYVALDCPESGGQKFTLDPNSVWAPVEYWVSWAWDESAQAPFMKQTSEVISQFEAAAVAQDLLQLRASGQLKSWSEAMILFRTGSTLDRTLRAFREAGIPYAVERDRNYYRRREIIEASALVRTVLDPMDHLAMMTLLRSAMAGVPDAAWIPLWKGMLPKLFSCITGPESPEVEEIRLLGAQVEGAIRSQAAGLDRIHGWHHSLNRVVQSVAYLREAYRSLTSDRFVDSLRDLFMIESVEGARFLGLYRVANLERFFRSLKSLIEDFGADNARIVRELRYLVSNQMDAEEAKPLDGGQDAVSVMTIHKSKGLKAKHVYMLGLHRKKSKPMMYQSLGEQTRATGRTGQWEYMLLGATTLGYQSVLDLEQHVDQAESLRTLYVGMTRAAERLVLLGSWPDPSRGKGRAGAHTHLEPLQDTRPDVSALVTGMKSCHQKNLSYFDNDGARWVFPSLRREVLSSNKNSGVAVNLPDLKRVQEQILETRERRLRAQERQARSLGASVTSMAESQHNFSSDEPTSGVDALVAATAGTVVHAYMEVVDLEGASAVDIGALSDLVNRHSAGMSLEKPFLDAIFQRASDCLEGFLKSQLFQDYLQIYPTILARELSLLIPSDSQGGPVEFISGTLDMLYQDPNDGAFVVVDYKTDHVADEASAKIRAESYQTQGSLYCTAVDAALKSPVPSRCELWFLETGTRVSLGSKE